MNRARATPEPRSCRRRNGPPGIDGGSPGAVIQQTARLAAIAMASGLLAGCTSIPDAVTGQPTYNTFSIEEDVQLGQEVQSQNLEAFRQLGVPIDRDTRQLRKVQETVERLRGVVELPDLPWEVHLIQTNIVNAAAAPGGKILVFAGLFDPERGMAQNDAELAAVIAHEMAHVTCRHVTESLTRQMGMESGAQILAAVLGQTAGSRAADVFSYVYSGANMILLPHYSREQESEADSIGLSYMARAGYDPQAALEIWRRAAAQGGEASGGMFGFLASHPSNLTRLRQLEQRLPAAREEYLRATGQRPATLPGPLPARPVPRPSPLTGPSPVVRARPVLARPIAPP